MQITITIKVQNNGNSKEFDVRVERGQNIRESLAIIFQGMRIQKDMTQINFIKSRNRKRWISLDYTYEQGEVFTGEILEILE